LEIARNVQLTFLPRAEPKIEGMDVSSLCVPAREVGGDYYDFIELSPRKLGVVIGDVSGKGISAAFYMTLTKGFLRSQAKGPFSPREILINMNELFYENAERGIFISMIYALFDLEARTLTFARAGHNPMILRRPGKGEAEELDAPGIALGLERGDIFSQTIEERTIGIEKKDVFFFYTDGLNETQNLRQEEFGEDRLLELVEKHSQLPSEELLYRVQEEIMAFAGEASQHDDMTAVVVRII
jgi:sigma-B regulation protein RsbU (phosphoserine phosphatase)